MIVSSIPYSYGQITYQGCFAEMNNGGGDYETFTFYNTSTDATGRNIFETTPVDGAQPCNTCFGFGYGELRMAWDNSSARWTLQLTGDGVQWHTIYYNTPASIPNPPDLSLGVWIENTALTSGGCGGNGTINMLSGDVQSNTLGVNQVTLQQKIKLSPNPANEIIKISGLNTPNNFVIYANNGVRIQEGTISDNEIIEIEKLPNDIFFIKIGAENTLRFIKK